MQWNHLPVAGGLYDQDPRLLDRWRVIWEEQGKKDKADEAKRKAEAKRSSSTRSAGRVRRR